MARFLFRPPQAWLASFMERYRLITAYLLPPHLAAGFELSRRGAAGRQRHESSLAMLRRLHPHLPRRLRFLPAYLEAQRRIAGRTGRDRIGEQLNRLFVGSPDTR
jgi:uncharacterized protein (DUF2236 family)